MKTKKIFGIGAVVLMILIAFVPAINGLQLDEIKKDDIEKEISSASVGSWDLKITFEEAIFDHYHETEDIVYYKITYTIENIGEGTYSGRPNAYLRAHEKQWLLASWGWPKSDDLELSKNEKVTISTVQPIDFDNEIWLAGRVADLETGCFDGQGLEDPLKSNNIDYATGNFWEKLNSRSFEPDGNHYEACRPHEQWVDHYETIVFPDENQTGVVVPIFKDVYANFIIPRLFGSDRFGWLGKTVDLLIDVIRATCNLTAANLEVLAVVVLLVEELYLGVIGVIALIESIASGNVVLEAVIVSALFLDLAAICVTLEKLLDQIEDLQEPGDPHYDEFVRATGVFLSYMSTYPWYDDISIFGEINNCKSGEKVEISCRNVKKRNIPGGEGHRDIESFDVTSDFSWTLYRDNRLLMRNCQVTITGDKHTNNINAKPTVGQPPLKTRRMFSYVAPGGSLQIIAGFKPKSRAVNGPLYIFLQRLLEIFPFLKQILSPSFF